MTDDVTLVSNALVDCCSNSTDICRSTNQARLPLVRPRVLQQGPGTYPEPALLAADAAAEAADEAEEAALAAAEAAPPCKCFVPPPQFHR